MFTGIIQEIGNLERKGSRVCVHSDLDLSDVHAGDSIAINGICLTTLESNALVFDLGPETLARTVLSSQKVNIEKALRFSDRLGGHLLQGHVDGIGKVIALKPEAESL